MGLFSIKGVSGSGESTFLNVVSGLQKPTLVEIVLPVGFSFSTFLRMRPHFLVDLSWRLLLVESNFYLVVSTIALFDGNFEKEREGHGDSEGLWRRILLS